MRRGDTIKRCGNNILSYKRMKKVKSDVMKTDGAGERYDRREENERGLAKEET